MSAALKSAMRVGAEAFDAALNVVGPYQLPKTPEGEKNPTQPDLERNFADGFTDIGADALFLREEAWREAQGLVNRAIERGGRDPRFPLASDTRAMRSIAELLISVQESKQEPSDEELLSAHKRGQEVAKALGSN